MKALNLYGIQDVRYEDISKPNVQGENDVLIKVYTAEYAALIYPALVKLDPIIQD